MCFKLPFLPRGPGSSYCCYHPLHRWGDQGAEKLSKITQLVTGKVGFRSRQSGSSSEPALCTAPRQTHSQVLPECLSLPCNLSPSVSTTYTTCNPLSTLRAPYTAFHALLPDTLWSLHMLVSLRRTVFSCGEFHSCSKSPPQWSLLSFLPTLLVSHGFQTPWFPFWACTVCLLM